MEETVITIKLSSSEVSLLINSLGMLESAIVPCVDDGKWKIPYEQLKKDLQEIQKKVATKHKEVTILRSLEDKHDDMDSIIVKARGKEKCEECND